MHHRHAILATVTVVLLALVGFLVALYQWTLERDYDCKDFRTQLLAQEYLLPGDPYRLDGDHDGRACQALPAL